MAFSTVAVGSLDDLVFQRGDRQRALPTMYCAG
jgi:hypothetical protein